MTTIQDMYAAVDAAAQTHFEWCSDHDYVNEADPRVQLCRSRFGLDFTGSGDRDDVTALTVELTGSQADVEHGFPVPLASIGFNGQFGEREIAVWKLVPTAFAMLAAAAHAEGDQARAQAFTDAAQAAILEHLTEAEAEQGEPEYTVAQPARHWSEGPFDYVMVGQPDGGVITFDQYEVEQSLAAGIPQWVVQRAEDGPGFVVVGALDEKPVDGKTYGEFSDAKAVRDRLNGRARAEAQVRQIAAYDIDDEVTPTEGAFAGQAGIVDELDLGDDDKPFRVRFEHVDGEPIAWFGARELQHAGGAQ